MPRRRLPTVLAPDEVAAVLARMSGVHGLLARLLYGTGMRITEGLQLRVKDHTYRGDSLWQLWLAEPELCRAELMPLLAVLRPDWQLAQQASVTKQLLGTLAPAQDREHRQRWQSLVNKLAHDRAALREQAYRELFAARPAVLVYLRTLDPDTLDAEQRYHVRHLLSAIQGDEDTPLSAALDLFGSEH